MAQRSLYAGRSLHCAAGAHVRERRKKPAAPVGMTKGGVGYYVGAEAPTHKAGGRLTQAAGIAYRGALNFPGAQESSNAPRELSHDPPALLGFVFLADVFLRSPSGRAEQTQSHY